MARWYIYWWIDDSPGLRTRSCSMTPAATTSTRRRFLTGGGLVVTSIMLATSARAQPGAAGSVTNDGFRLLRAQRASVELRGSDKGTTPVETFDGAVPGPLIRAK